MRIIIAIALLAGLAAPVVVGADATATTYQVDIPLPPQLPTCTGALLNTSGTIHEMVHETDNTGFHFVAVANSQNGSAVDPVNALAYRLIDVSIDDFQATPGATTSQTLLTLRFVGQGQTPDLSAMTIIHNTFNANGTLTAVIDTSKSMCPGS